MCQRYSLCTKRAITRHLVSVNKLFILFDFEIQEQNGTFISAHQMLFNNSSVKRTASPKLRQFTRDPFLQADVQSYADLSLR